jgi:DhnA family fructose-bisphosphate aldolase class Ia
MSSIGKAIRFGRLLNGGKQRSACLAFDHGLHVGDIDGARDLLAGVKLAVDAGFDGIILSPGAATRAADLLAGRNRPSIVMRIDQTSMWRIGLPSGYRDGDVRAVTSVAEAAQMGADAVLSYVFIAHKDQAGERRSVELATETAMAARRLGLVYVAEPMAARGGIFRDPFDPKVVAIHTRMAVEIGADVIKTDWPGSASACKSILKNCAGVPMLVAGGKRSRNDQDTLRLVADLLEGGANGIMFGRALFQSPHPLRLMRTVREMIHDDLSFAQAARKIGLAPGRRRAA